MPACGAAGAELLLPPHLLHPHLLHPHHPRPRLPLAGGGRVFGALAAFLPPLLPRPHHLRRDAELLFCARAVLLLPRLPLPLLRKEWEVSGGRGFLRALMAALDGRLGALTQLHPPKTAAIRRPLP